MFIGFELFGFLNILYKINHYILYHNILAFLKNKFLINIFVKSIRYILVRLNLLFFIIVP